MNVLAKLSLGHLADRLAHAIGWSPIAKSVVISHVEGPSAGLFEGLVGTVRSIQGCVMILEPDRAAHQAWSEGSRLRLTARHEGWTPFSLCVGPITVVIEAEQFDGRPVAIGTVKMLRRRTRIPGG
jgi:hypothetical protein